MALSKLKSNFVYYLLAGLLFFMSSCGQIEVFEKNTPIPDYKWATGFPATGTFQITDTSSSYNIYIVLRHTDKYDFNNIWLKYILIFYKKKKKC